MARTWCHESELSLVFALSCFLQPRNTSAAISHMIEESLKDVGDEKDRISIVYGDESLPRHYENSSTSSKQLTSQHLVNIVFGCMLFMII